MNMYLQYRLMTGFKFRERPIADPTMFLRELYITNKK